ncbi:hypothetical protein PA25_24910 [Pseudoalteromonas sp. A25]|uniref:helix-turn-helix domain-containing protein n=1 Tax=Pseudoalteromonas sp. A25 TaxID=116092 RepID=UPI001260D0AF|nr:AraC family transcriptional regulator [Pseudoalteromonas sp. A25]BBN82506.1 hypothetical protein PA25_24910 [Pseudoalteromonas sp. A25]
MTINQQNVLEILFSSLSLGVGSFAMHLFFDKIKQQPFYLPLLLLLLGLTIISASGIVFFAFNNAVITYIAILPPCFLMLAPSLWLYTNGLVASEPWQLTVAALKHYLPAIASLILTFTLLLTPSALLNKMFFSNETITATAHSTFISIAIMVTIAVWFIQTIAYLVKLSNLTRRYHQQLKDVFCDLTNKKYKWLIYLTITMLINWIWAALAVVFDSSDNLMFSAHWGQALCLITIWGLSYYGLKQQPGFNSLYQQKQTLITSESSENDTTRYQRSALTQEKAQQIADKVQCAIEHDQIYLDSSLTLFKLAKHLNEPSQYVSQTLSQIMQTSFFECINNARVEAAKVKLLSGQGNVLDIAMSVGFNARSSFYKAFKAGTGQTPSQFQKSHHS